MKRGASESAGRGAACRKGASPAAQRSNELRAIAAVAAGASAARPAITSAVHGVSRTDEDSQIALQSGRLLGAEGVRQVGEGKCKIRVVGRGGGSRHCRARESGGAVLGERARLRPLRRPQRVTRWDGGRDRDGERREPSVLTRSVTVLHLLLLVKRCLATEHDVEQSARSPEIDGWAIRRGHRVPWAARRRPHPIGVVPRQRRARVILIVVERAPRHAAPQPWRGRAVVLLEEPRADLRSSVEGRTGQVAEARGRDKGCGA
eukprot:scaffold6928_cov36-Tisochrysis_lutea.AAC.2